MANLLVIHGPNLNLLGTREPHIYGEETLESLNQTLDQLATEKGHELSCFQSNAEHEIIDCIHLAIKHAMDFIIINAGALTHTSIALRDALAASNIPFIEVHISNVFKRESFRHHSYLSDLAVGMILGFGVNSYTLALQGAMDYLNQPTRSV